MTSVLLIVAFVFCLTTAPLCIYYVLVPMLMEDGNTTFEEFQLYVLLYALVCIAYYMNNSINFMLYCLTSKRFRREFFTMIGLKNRIYPESTATSETGT